MTDRLTPAQRSYCMSCVKSKDTSIELTVRSSVHRRGLRFRKYAKGLPGRPDIVFPTERLAVFVDGDFWHGYRFARWEHTLGEFWRNKISNNRSRDSRNFGKLRRMGWTVLRVWEHSIEKDCDSVADKIECKVRELRMLKDRTV